MDRIALLLAVALGLAACGGSDSPSVTQVTVTVRQGGAVLQNAPVVMSAAIDDLQSPPVPIGIPSLEQFTSSSGQTLFTVPSSTSTGSLCFSSSRSSAGGYSFVDACATLNALSPSILLEHP